MRRISSKKSDLLANIKQLKEWFRERGYPKDWVNRETKRAFAAESAKMLQKLTHFNHLSIRML